MGVSLVVDNNLILSLAEKIAQARKLYGPDSSYVIGLVTSFEWFVEGADGKEDLKQLLRDHVLEFESGNNANTPATPVTPAISAPENDQELSENSWIKGVVKWFNNDKGYGFISTEGDVDVFVHWRDISSWDRSISQDEEVEFMVTKTAKGFQAVNVMKSKQAEDEVNSEEESNNENAPEGESTSSVEEEIVDTGAPDQETEDTQGTDRERGESEATGNKSDENSG